MNATKQARASVGGEIGANGEWYEGGKFIATINRAKGSKPTATRRQQVSFGVWEVPPSDKSGSCFAIAAGIVRYNHSSGMFDFSATPNAEQLKQTYPEAFCMAERFNSGERWF